MCIQTLTYSPPYSLTRRLQKYEKSKKKKKKIGKPSDVSKTTPTSWKASQKW